MALIELEPLVHIVGVVLVSLLGWWGARGLRGHWQFRRSYGLDISTTAPAPPPVVEAVRDRLRSQGFVPLGVSRSARPILGTRVTAWVLLDPAGTSLAEVTRLPQERDAIHAFATIFGDGTVLLTGDRLGGERRARGLVMQHVVGDPEQTWGRHREAVARMTADHGPPRPCRDMADALHASQTVRERLVARGFGYDRLMLGAWVAAALLVWLSMALGLVLGPPTLDAWLAAQRWPLLVGLVVAALAGLPDFFGLFRRR